jgi:hypothetical protein
MAEWHLIGQEPIRKSMPSGHDPMGVELFSLATNAEPRLREDNAQSNTENAMAIQAEFICRAHCAIA